MAQNITLLGASYSAVPAVLLPKTGGGTARFDDASVTTAGASDVASGKIFLAANGTITTGTASGGGGASNIVTGTFKGTTTGAAMDITLPYTGNGYPVSISISPTNGYQDGSSAYSLLQRYAVMHITGTKRNTLVPTYASTGGENQFVICGSYKSSASSASTLSAGQSQNRYVLTGGDATSTNTYSVVTFKSKNKMSVYIASTSYGFAANIEYTYRVIYSTA